MFFLLFYLISCRLLIEFKGVFIFVFLLLCLIYFSFIFFFLILQYQLDCINFYIIKQLYMELCYIMCFFIIIIVFICLYFLVCIEVDNIIFRLEIYIELLYRCFLLGGCFGQCIGLDLELIFVGFCVEKNFIVKDEVLGYGFRGFMRLG